MAGAAISRSSFFFFLNLSPSSLSISKRLFPSLRSHLISSPPPFPTPSFSTIPPPLGITILNPTKPFPTHFPKSFTTSSSNEVEEEASSPRKRNTMVNFSLSSDSESESDSEDSTTTTTATSSMARKKKEINQSKLPPPYDPFSKKPAIEEPSDPKNLQEVFHNMRTEGLFNSAVKMFDGLSKDGLTHEALQLFGQIKDEGNIPDVVAHTAVIEAYANAGQGREALKVYLRMLACGVLPNAYTYAVLIKGLANGGDAKLLGDAKKYVVEMMGKGMRPNAGTYVAVFEAFAREGKEEEGRELLEEMRGKGFVPDEKAVREVVKDKRGPVFRSVMNMLFGK